MIAFDFDTAMEDAWRCFRIALGDRLGGLHVGEQHAVAPSREFEEGPHSVLVFTVTRANRLRCTVSVAELHPTPAFGSQQLPALLAAGWRWLRDGRLIYEVGRRRADELAHVAIQVLREIWEVPHPAFLDGAPTEREAAIAIGTLPESRKHLLRLVCQALEPIAGHPIVLDEDGDIPLPTPKIPSWLHISDDDTAIEFAATLVDEVDDMAAATELVARESLGWPGLKLILHESRLLVHMTIHMAAFHRENLIAGLCRWFEFIAEHAPGVIEAATDATSPEPATEDLPEALQTLIVLDGDGMTLDADEVATICGHDRAEILRFIRTSQEQYLEWMASAAQADSDGDEDEAVACRNEEHSWRETTEKLRAALRIVALRGHSGVPGRDLRWTGS